MLATAFDDRTTPPAHLAPFLANTSAFCDLRLITPARPPRRTPEVTSGTPFALETVHPERLPLYRHAARLFDGVFVNYSTNSDSFERACFHRWFALNAATHSLRDNDFVCLLDTDFMLGMAPSDLLALCQTRAAGRHLHFIANWSDQSTAVVFPEITIMTKSYLFGFCEYLLTVYFSPAMRSRLVQDYFAHIGRGREGGVCDMRALAAYADLRRDQVFNLRHLPGVRIISNFNYFLKSETGNSDDWKITIRPGAQILQTGSEVTPLIGVHFQGSAKIYMPLAARAGAELTRAACRTHRETSPGPTTRIRRRIGRLFQ